MGTISISSGLILFLIIASSVIAVFPENIFGIELVGIHRLKNSMFYVYSVLIYFALIASIIIGVSKGIQFIRENKSIQYATLFVLTFDEKHWNRLRKSLA